MGCVWSPIYCVGYARGLRAVQVLRVYPVFEYTFDASGPLL